MILNDYRMWTDLVAEYSRYFHGMELNHSVGLVALVPLSSSTGEVECNVLYLQAGGVQHCSSK